jgi:hypothetical protein
VEDFLQPASRHTATTVARANRIVDPLNVRFVCGRRYCLVAENVPLSATTQLYAETNVPLMEVVPDTAAVNRNGPYWHVGGLAGFRMIETVGPLTVPITSPLSPWAGFGKVVAHVPDTESFAAWTSVNDTVPFPRRASLTCPDQLPLTLTATGPVTCFPEHATTATIPTIRSTRCISTRG